MKAVILAAGAGQRFRPLTNTRPKPMLPVGDAPLLEHVVESLNKAGITEIVIVVGHRKERIQNHFGNGDAWELDIEYVSQKHPRGTGDALLQAEHTIGSDFLIVNGDRVVDPSLLDQLATARKTTATNQIAVTKVADPTQYGMLEIDGDEVTDFVEKPAAHEVTSKIVNVGAYAFGPEMFAAIRQTETQGELALSAVLKQTLADHQLNAVRYDGLWFELTRPWDLLSANEQWLDRHGGTHAASATIHPDASQVAPTVVGADTSVQPGARLLQHTVIGSNVTIGANAVVENSVVLDGATIHAGAVVHDAIVGAEASIGPNTTVSRGKSDVVIGETLHTDVQFGGLVGDHATIGAGVTIEPGTILNNGAVVFPQDTVSGTFPTTAHQP